jgi:hypothetical protein
MAMNCDEINQVASELKMKFEAGMTLSANDLDLLVELTLAARDCSGEVVSIDSAHYKAPLETITDLTNLNYLLLTDQERHYVKETNIEYVWQAEATQGQYEPFDKGVNTQGFWLKMDYAVFTDTQEDRLRDSVYEDLTQTLSVSPTSFEKGVSTNLTFTWKVTKNDDTLNTVTVDNIDKLNEATGINRTYVVNNQIATKSVQLAVNLTRNTVIPETFTETSTVTSNGYVPQFKGQLADTLSANTYNLTDFSATTKLIQNGKNMSLSETFTNKYAVILTKTAISQIVLSVAPEPLSIGTWDDGVSYFYEKVVTLTLADGSTESMFLYRTRQLLNATTTFNIS